MRIKWNLSLIGTVILGALLLCQMEYGIFENERIIGQ